MSKYTVIDSAGYPLRVFNSYQEAVIFKLSNNRLDWRIKQ